MVFPSAVKGSTSRKEQNGIFLLGPRQEAGKPLVNSNIIITIIIRSARGRRRP
jgi:hypothetical protein